MGDYQNLVKQFIPDLGSKPGLNQVIEKIKLCRCPSSRSMGVPMFGIDSRIRIGKSGN